MATEGVYTPNMKVQVRMRDRTDPRYSHGVFQVTDWDIRAGVLVLTLPRSEEGKVRRLEQICFPLGSLLSFEVVLEVDASS